jgi:FMN phosphatase YigB (HAD superfamily)
MVKRDSAMKKPKVILFDLDGTLLRVQMAEFIPRYVHGLAACCEEFVKPAKFTKAMLEAISSLIRNDGNEGLTNEQRVMSHLHKHLSVSTSQLSDCFADFRQNGLNDLAELVKPIPLARNIVAECLAAGVPLVLATNPVFPAFMIEARLQWGGLSDFDFAHLTSFENSCYCKPQSGYFREISTLLKVAPEDCLMVGNDTSHDLSAAAVGMETFLVDTWIVERDECVWPCDNRGDHWALRTFLQNCLT